MSENVPLSQMQMSVLDLYAQGMSQSEISNRTELSEISVALIFRSASRRLGASNRTQAVAIYLERYKTPSV